MVKAKPKTVAPKLRFPEFREAGEWDEAPLDELITTITPPAKLSSSQYRQTGKYPIIDQSQQDVCGWTDDENILVDESMPLIVFGDHTCALKLIREPFAQGADGIKILKAKSDISIDYLYQSLNYRPLVMEDYKRHFSILKERRILYPSISTGEQQMIADCLTSLDELIAAQGRKVEALKTYKRGLMQQLFPREGETMPRLRFPEFKNAPGWAEAAIGSRCLSFSGGTPDTSNESYYGGTIPFIRSAEIGKERTELFLSEAGLENSAAKMVDPGDVLVALYGANSGDVALARISGAINQAILCLRSAESNAFLCFFLAAKKDWILATYLQGGQGNLSGEIVKSITLKCPSKKEQEAVAQLLSSVDDEISTESGKFSLLRVHKQALMQQLFPSVEDTE